MYSAHHKHIEKWNDMTWLHLPMSKYNQGTRPIANYYNYVKYTDTISMMITHRWLVMLGKVWWVVFLVSCAVFCIMSMCISIAPLSPLLHCPSPSLPSDGTSCSTSSARTLNSTFLKISTRVAQVAGCLPLPPSHSFIISVQHATGFNGLDAAIISMVCPVGSKFRWIPTIFQCAAMCLIISTFFPEGAARYVSCSRVGCVSGGDVGVNEGERMRSVQTYSVQFTGRYQECTETRTYQVR